MGVTPQFTSGEIACHQPCQLRPRKACGAQQVAPQQALVGLTQPPVAEASQDALDVLVRLLPVRDQDHSCGLAREKLPDMFQVRVGLQFDMQNHPPMIPTSPSEAVSGSSLVGNNPPLQAHLSLEEACLPLGSAHDTIRKDSGLVYSLAAVLVCRIGRSCHSAGQSLTSVENIA